MKYRIEKNIPPPPKAFDYKGFTAFLRTLEIGDSFVCGDAEMPRLKSCAHQADIKITTKTIHKGDDIHGPEYRVWRIE